MPCCFCKAVELFLFYLITPLNAQHLLLTKSTTSNKEHNLLTKSKPPIKKHITPLHKGRGKPRKRRGGGASGEGLGLLYFMTTFESNVKQIAYPQQTVYDTLSDLTHLQGLKDRMEAIKGQLTDEQRKQAEQLNNLTFDADSLSIEAPMVGKITLRVIDREPLKTIKFETENSPIPFNLWIQLLPTSDTTCKLKLTLKGDIPFMLKSMVKKPLQKGIEKVADMMAMIPY